MAKFCDAIVTYVANIDRAPDKSITVAKYSVQTMAALEVMFQTWLTSAKEPKLRAAIVECIGLMTHVISREKLESLMPKLIPGLLALYVIPTLRVCSLVRQMFVLLCLAGTPIFFLTLVCIWRLPFS
jgi:hypothetical protein